MASISSVEITGHKLITSGVRSIEFQFNIVTSRVAYGDVASLGVGFRYVNGTNGKYDSVTSEVEFDMDSTDEVIWPITWEIPFDYLFCGGTFSFFIRAGTVRSDWYNIYLPAAFSLPSSSFMIPERPTQHDQFIYYDGVYKGEAGCCVASAIAAAKEVQEIRSSRGVIQNSVGWFFGATADGEDGTTYETAFNFLRDHGMMPAKYVQTSYVSRYPDVYFYNDKNGYSGGRSLYLNNQSDAKSLPQKIGSWKRLTGEWNQSFNWQSIFDAIQRTSGKGSSAVVVSLGIDEALDATGGDGLMLDCYGYQRAGHMMLVLGWKTINSRLYFVCQNSWGAGWGDDGLVYIPFTNIRYSDPDNVWIGLYDFWEIVDDPKAPEDPGLEPWSWNASNGAASAAATLKAYNAIKSNASLTDFSYLVWNDMVDKLKEILDYKGYSWATTFASFSDTKMSLSDKTLTAKRFNSLRFNIGSHYSTGINTVDSGDVVYGWYFITLTECMNHMI